jgi:hypothetical protein
MLLRFAKSDDGTSSQGRRASRANQLVLDRLEAYASNASYGRSADTIVVALGPCSTSDLVRPSGLTSRCQVWPATVLLPSEVPARDCSSTISCGCRSPWFRSM